MKYLFCMLCVLPVVSASSQNVGIGTTTPQHKLHVQGTLFVNSATGSLKLGYPGTTANFLEFSTFNGGADLRVSTTSEAGTVRYPYYFSQDGRLGINLDTTPDFTPNYALHVAARNKFAIYGITKQFGSDTVAGVYGFASSPTPVGFSAGVRGESNSINQNGIGVLGIQTGSGWGVAGFVKQNNPFYNYGAGVYGAAGSSLTGAGNGGYGVLGINQNPNGVGGNFRNYGPASGKALVTEGGVQLTGISEGANKVLTSDINGNATWQQLPAFIHTATAANTSGYITSLSYTNPLHTDIVLVTANFNPVGSPSTYNNHPIGVYWNGATWTVFNQDFASIINSSYNVMVVRQ